MAKKTVPEDSFQLLKNAIKRNALAGLYVFYGEETFLMSHYLEEIRKKLLEPLTESFNFHRFNAENFNITDFANAIENLPMMAEHTLVQADDIDLFKLSEGERETAAALLSDIPEYCTVIFTYLTVSWKPDKRQKKLWDTIEKNACVVEFQKQRQQDLVFWTSRHFAAKGKKIANDLCVYLIDITGGTMTALNGEIEKICAYSRADEIKKSDIDAVTEPVLDAAVFQMTDCIAAGSYEKAILGLQRLLKMQQEPLVILGAIGSQFRRIGAAKTLQERGKGMQELQSLYGLKEYPARKLLDSSRRMDKSFCAGACALIADTDYKIKTSYDSPERLLEMLIIQLAVEAGRA